MSFIAVASAEEKVATFQCGLLVPDIAIEECTTRINGCVLGLWTENPQSALSMSVVNGATEDSAGFQMGVFVNYAENFTGVQMAPFNKVANNFTGFQAGGLNFVDGHCEGFQLGVMNIAREACGFQLGLVNVATELYGVQIGLANVNISNEFFTKLPEELAPGMVFVNWKF